MFSIFVRFNLSFEPPFLIYFVPNTQRYIKHSIQMYFIEYWKIVSYPPYIINTMATEGMSAQEARTPTDMVLTCISRVF